jgi:DNA-binding protein Fis
LDKTKGIKKKAAELLHINFRSMRYRLEKYGLNHGSDSELA